MHLTRKPTMIYISSDPMNAAEQIYTYAPNNDPDASHKPRRISSLLLELDDDIREVVRDKERALLELEFKSKPKSLQKSLLQRQRDLKEGIILVGALSRRPSWTSASSQAVRDSLPVALQHRVAALEWRMHRLLSADHDGVSAREAMKVQPELGNTQPHIERSPVNFIGQRSRQGALARTAARIERIRELERRYASLVSQYEGNVKAQAKAKAGIIECLEIMDERNAVINDVRLATQEAAVTGDAAVGSIPEADEQTT